MLEINGLEYINSCEGVFGNMIYRDRKLLIPYHNVNIMANETEYLKDFGGNYLKYCCLQFEGVYGIAWDYEVSRFLQQERRECYGGINFIDKEDCEFWISYKIGKLLIPEKIEVSTQPWNIEMSELEDYFNNNLPL